MLTLRISVAMSEWGWSNSELGVEWIKHYHEETQAGSTWRLVSFDGHETHITLELI